MKTSLSNEKIQMVSGVIRALRRQRPKNRHDLKNYLQAFLGINVPDIKICPDHCSPMDYVWDSFNGDFDPSCSGQDKVIWANRGGGKTRLAAAVTLLDAVFKPNCQIRILGGSQDQSCRMYDYLRTFVDNGFADTIEGNLLRDRCNFVNGSNVEVLAQSMKSVRGQHVQKLRCDEAELFDNDVFSASKFITKSSKTAKSAMEILSTMHKPYGIMQQCVDNAAQNGLKIYNWCMWEVVENCKNRVCSQCPLWQDCGGKAKNSNGFLNIDDCITIQKRVSRSCWENEMLCKRPNLENAVFGDFSADLHVKSVDYNPNLPLFRAIDFGFINPFVCLWIQADDNGKIYVIDEFVRQKASIYANAQEIKNRSYCDESRVFATFCDPAGAAVDDITGTSAVKELKNLGIKTIWRQSGILEGIELIRRHLKNGEGISRLVISPRCVRLIESLKCYHYPDRPADELPEKDGVYDHQIDALRYFFVNYTNEWKLQNRRY